LAQSRPEEKSGGCAAIAIVGRVYESYRSVLDSPRWQRIFNSGARAQRLLFAITGTKDPKASDTLYIQALAAPFTVNTMPEVTLKAPADHGTISETLPTHVEDRVAKFAKAGIDTDALGLQLQDEGATSFVKSWKDLMECIASKSEMLKAA
jgi:transaldolase